MNIPKPIQEAIINDKLVIFAGAGLSSKFNLPNWKKLVIDIINDIDNKVYNTLLAPVESEILSPIETLEKLKGEHSAINKYIKKNFKIETGDTQLHKNLFELSGKIVTTNFDNAFELSINNSIDATIYTSDYNVSEINKNSTPYIFKLHGSYNEPDKCIIFNDQYNKLYSEETASISKLKSIFSDKLILFIGFSFHDPHISLIFNTLDNIFSNNNKHFILTTHPKEFEKFNFLESIKIENYDELNSVVSELLTFKNSIKIEDSYKVEKTYQLKSNVPR